MVNWNIINLLFSSNSCFCSSLLMLLSTVMITHYIMSHIVSFVLMALLFYWGWYCKEKVDTGHSWEANKLAHSILTSGSKFSILFPFNFLGGWVRIICLITSKSFFSWWSSPLLSWPFCVIQGWNCKEKLDADHSKGVKEWRQLNTNNLPYMGHSKHGMSEFCYIGYHALKVKNFTCSFSHSWTKFLELSSWKKSQEVIEVHYLRRVWTLFTPNLENRNWQWWYWGHHEFWKWNKLQVGERCL